jgi:hypothetical protein
MTSRPWAWLAAFTCACAASPAKQDPEVAVVRHVDHALGGMSTTPLAGARCKGRHGSCSCRIPGDDTESEPPATGFKRLEIRLGSDGGSATFDGLGHFETAGPQESCFYVDVPAGQTTDLRFAATADRPTEGVSPRLRLAEYGPKGPYWYGIIDVECKGAQGRCDRQGADAWAARNVRERKRGRLDPCGSAVVTKLAWDTSGGQADRDGGLFRDVSVRFTLEVKKFATQFAPGSTECVPK